MSQTKVKIERESPGADEIEFEEYQQQDFNLKFEPEEDEDTVKVRVVSDFFCDNNNDVTSDPEDFPLVEASGGGDKKSGKKGKRKSTMITRSRRKPRRGGEPPRRRRKRVTKLTSDEQESERPVQQKKTSKSESRPRSGSSRRSKSTSKKVPDVDHVAGEQKKSEARRKKRVSEMTAEELERAREMWRVQRMRRRLRGQGLTPEEIEEMIKSNPPLPPKNTLTSTSGPNFRTGYTRTGPPGERRKKKFSEMTPEEQEKIREQWRQQKERRRLRLLAQGVNSVNSVNVKKSLTPEQRSRRRQRTAKLARERYAKMAPEQRAEFNQRRTLRELEKIAKMSDEEKRIYDFKKLCRLENLKKKRLQMKEIPVVETEEEAEKRRESYRRYYENYIKKAEPERRRRIAEMRKISNRRYKERRAQREGRVYIPRFKSDQCQRRPKPKPRPRSTKPKSGDSRRSKMTPEELMVRRRELQRKRRMERNKKIMAHVASGMTVDEAYAQFETPEKRQERLLLERIKFAQRRARIGLRESGASQEVIDRKMEEIEESLRMNPGRIFQPYKMRNYKKTKSEPDTDLQQSKNAIDDHDEVQLETRSKSKSLSASVTFDTGGHQDDDDGDHDQAEIHSQSQNHAAVPSFIITTTGTSWGQHFGHLQRAETEDGVNHGDDEGNDHSFGGNDDDFQNSPCASPDSPLEFTETKLNVTTSTSVPLPPPPPENPNQGQPLPPQPKRGRGRPKKGEVVISLKQQRLMQDPELRAARRQQFERTGARLDPGETLESARVVVCDLCGLMYRRKTFLRHRVHHHNPYLPPGSGRNCGLCDKKMAVKGQHHMFNHFRYEHPAEFEEIRAPIAHIIGNQPGASKSKENDDNISKLDHLCEECGRGFSEAKRLYEHVYRHHGPEKPKEEDRPVCDLCPEHLRRPFTLRSSYLKHLKKKHPEAVGQRKRAKICGPCGQTFATRELLLAHLEANHPGKSHPCSLCPMVFFTRAGAIYHLQRCNGKPTTAQRNEIERNAENEPEETRPLILRKLGVHCEFCGSRQILKGLVTHYLESHAIMEDKGFQCWRCEKTYNVRDYLVAHLYDFHGVEWDDEFRERIRKVNLSEEKRANLVVLNPEGKINGCKQRTIRKIKYREKKLKMLGMEVTQENLERMKWGKVDRSGNTKKAGSRSRSRSKSSSGKKSKNSWSESESEDQQDAGSESEAESWKSSESKDDFQGDVDEDLGNRRRSSRIVQKKMKTALRKSVKKRSGSLKRNVRVRVKQEVQMENVEIKKKLVVIVTKLSAEEIAKYTKKSHPNDQ